MNSFSVIEKPHCQGFLLPKWEDNKTRKFYKIELFCDMYKEAGEMISILNEIPSIKGRFMSPMQPVYTRKRMK